MTEEALHKLDSHVSPRLEGKGGVSSQGLQFRRGRGAEASRLGFVGPEAVVCVCGGVGWGQKVGQGQVRIVGSLQPVRGQGSGECARQGRADLLLST